MKHIMIIDNICDAECFGETLSDFFSFSSAESFAKLSEKIEDGIFPDAIVVNADFTGDDTETLLCELKTNAQLCTLPVMLVTKSADYFYQEKLCALDADDIVVLPLCERLIVRKINAMIAGASDERKYSSVCIKFDQLIDMVAEKEHDRGALLVGQSHFKSIYRFVMRGLERSEKNVQVVLFTLSCDSDSSDESHEQFMEMLSDAVCQCLRKGDISSVCSRNQVVILLVGADDDGGHLVANRILSNFYSECQDDNYELQYDIREIKVN